MAGNGIDVKSDQSHNTGGASGFGGGGGGLAGLGNDLKDVVERAWAPGGAYAEGRTLKEKVLAGMSTQEIIGVARNEIEFERDLSLGEDGGIGGAPGTYGQYYQQNRRLTQALDELEAGLEVRVGTSFSIDVVIARIEFKRNPETGTLDMSLSLGIRDYLEGEIGYNTGDGAYIGGALGIGFSGGITVQNDGQDPYGLQGEIGASLSGSAHPFSEDVCRGDVTVGAEVTIGGYHAEYDVLDHIVTGYDPRNQLTNQNAAAK